MGQTRANAEDSWQTLALRSHRAQRGGRFPSGMRSDSASARISAGKHCPTSAHQKCPAQNSELRERVAFAGKGATSGETLPVGAQELTPKLERPKSETPHRAPANWRPGHIQSRQRVRGRIPELQQGPQCALPDREGGGTASQVQLFRIILWRVRARRGLES